MTTRSTSVETTQTTQTSGRRRPADSARRARTVRGPDKNVALISNHEHQLEQPLPSSDGWAQHCQFCTASDDSGVGWLLEPVIEVTENRIRLNHLMFEKFDVRPGMVLTVHSQFADGDFWLALRNCLGFYRNAPKKPGGFTVQIPGGGVRHADPNELVFTGELRVGDGKVLEIVRVFPFVVNRYFTMRQSPEDPNLLLGSMNESWPSSLRPNLTVPARRSDRVRMNRSVIPT